MKNSWEPVEERYAGYKNEAEGILRKAESESRALTDNEEHAFEQLRGKMEESQAVIRDMKDAEIARLTAAPSTPASPDVTPAFNGFRDFPVGKELPLITNTLLETNAGYSVPQSWASQYEAYRSEANFMRSICKVIQTESTHNIPVMTSAGTAALIAENTAYADCGTIMCGVQLGAYKMTRKEAVSEELLADAQYDVAGLLAESFGRAIGACEEQYFVTGTGSSQPGGLFLSTMLCGTSTYCTTFAVDDLIGLVYKLARQYRDGAVFVTNDSTALAIRKMKYAVTTNGCGYAYTDSYFWTDGAGAGEPPTLLGHKLYTHSNVPTPATGCAAIAFFNPQFFTIADRGAMTMKRLELSEYATTFALAERVDGRPTLVSAFKALTFA